MPVGRVGSRGTCLPTLRFTVGFMALIGLCAGCPAGSERRHTLLELLQQPHTDSSGPATSAHDGGQTEFQRDGIRCDPSGAARNGRLTELLRGTWQNKAIRSIRRVDTDGQHGWEATFNEPVDR